MKVEEVKGFKCSACDALYDTEEAAERCCAFSSDDIEILSTAIQSWRIDPTFYLEVTAEVRIEFNGQEYLIPILVHGEEVNIDDNDSRYIDLPEVVITLFEDYLAELEADDRALLTEREFLLYKDLLSYEPKNSEDNGI